METFKWRKHSADLLKNMGDFYKFKLNLDCSFLVEGQYLGGHKLILSAASPFFEELFLSHTGKKPITLKHIKYNDFKNLLDFIYFGIVKIPLKQVGSFIKAASSLQVPVPYGKCNKISTECTIEEDSQHINDQEDNTSTTNDASNILTYDDMTEKLRTISLSERILCSALIGDLESVLQSDASNTPTDKNSESEDINNSEPSGSINSCHSCITPMQQKELKIADSERNNENGTNCESGFEAQETSGEHISADMGVLKIVEETLRETSEGCQQKGKEVDMMIAKEDDGYESTNCLKNEETNYERVLGQDTSEVNPSTSKESHTCCSDQKQRPTTGGGFQEKTLKAGGDCKENKPVHSNSHVLISDYVTYNKNVAGKIDTSFPLKGKEKILDTTCLSSLKLKEIKKEKIKRSQNANEELKVCLCDYLPLGAPNHFIIIKNHKRSHRDKKKKNEKKKKREKEDKIMKRGDKQHPHSPKLHRSGSSQGSESQPKHSHKSSKRKQPEEGAEAMDDLNARSNARSRRKTLKMEEKVPEAATATDADVVLEVEMPSTSRQPLQIEDADTCTATAATSPDYLVWFPSSEESRSAGTPPSMDVCHGTTTSSRVFFPSPPPPRCRRPSKQKSPPSDPRVVSNAGVERSRSLCALSCRARSDRGRCARTLSATGSSLSGSGSGSQGRGCSRIIIEEYKESAGALGTGELMLVGGKGRMMRRKALKRTVSSTSGKAGVGDAMRRKEEEERWRRQEAERRRREDEVRTQREEERQRQARLQRKQDEERRRMDEERSRREEEERRRLSRLEKERLREDEALVRRLEALRHHCKTMRALAPATPAPAPAPSQQQQDDQHRQGSGSRHKEQQQQQQQTIM